MEPEEVVRCWHSDTDVFILDASEDRSNWDHLSTPRENFEDVMLQRIKRCSQQTSVRGNTIQLKKKTPCNRQTDLLWRLKKIRSGIFLKIKLHNSSFQLFPSELDWLGKPLVTTVSSDARVKMAASLFWIWGIILKLVFMDRRKALRCSAFNVQGWRHRRMHI